MYALYCALIIFVLIVLIWFIYKFTFGRIRWLSSEGKTILITGCDSGIGFHIAEEFYKKGSIVFATFLNSKGNGACLLREKCCDYNRFHIIQMDVTKYDQIIDAYNYIKSYLQVNNLQGLWALINNSGICVLGEFDWFSSEYCQSTIDVNLLGMIRVTKYFLPLIFKAKGRIINVSSVAGNFAISGMSVYVASKFGIDGFSHSLRLELNKYEIKVILIKPSFLTKYTSLFHKQDYYFDEMWNNMDEEKRNFYQIYFQQFRNYKKCTDRLNLSFEVLVKYFEEAVYAENSRKYIVCAPLNQKMFYYFMNLLPITCYDKIIKIGTNFALK